MPAGQEVFVTGGTGFIGRRVVDRLLARGDRIRCLVRTPSAASALEARGVKLIEGDITDPVALERGVRGAQLAFHLAALYDLGVVDEAALERTNVDGTRAFLRAVEHARTPRAVYVSSTAALPPAGHVDGGDEAWRGPFPSVYHRTKAEAHRIAREAQSRGVPVIIVCPPNVYGPGDVGPNGRFVRDAVRGRLPGLLRDPARFAYAYVDDVADAIVAAGDRGRPGETYVLDGDRLDLNTFAEQVAAAAGRKPPRLRFPTRLALIGGAMLDRVSRATGRRFVMSRESIAATSGFDWTHDDSKARAELGYRPRSVAEGLPATISAIRKN